MSNVARLCITCPDKPGIVAAVTNFLYSHGVNVTCLDQHSTDPEGGTFFMRLEFQTPHMDITRPALESSFQQVIASRFAMDWSLSFSSDPRRVAILVSTGDHCLMELLWRWARGELPCVVTAVIGNHPNLKEKAESFGLPFHYVPVTPETKSEAEARMLEILQGNADMLVLARYMQVLSQDFVSRFPQRIVNIHHSFLPAFVGADPYRQARERGVKIIGATAHYVTEELDGGPIIDQDVARVSHRHSLQDLKDLGRDLERQVLARAVKWVLEDRVIIHGNKTIVFK
jgi:formyltetrahydrofolate deformylase